MLGSSASNFPIAYFAILWGLQANSAGWSRCSRHRPLNSVGSELWNYACLILHPLTFSSSLKTPLWHPLHWHAAKHYDVFQASCATLTAFNHWEKNRKRTHSLSSHPAFPPSLWLSSLLRSPVCLLALGYAAAVCMCRGAAGALHCSAHWFTE